MTSSTEIYKKTLALLSGLVISQTLFAGTMGAVVAVPAYSFITTLALGPAWVDENNSRTIFLAPEIVKTYRAGNSSNSLVNGELFFGIGKQLRENISGQLGLALAGSTSAKMAGVIWDDAAPIFNNYAYNYRVTHAHVAVEGKLLANNSNFFVTPWIGASAGVGFNRAYDFGNTPLIFEAVRNPNFTDHSTTAFTYTVSAGVQRNISNNCQIGIGYQFADWGKSQLGPAFDQVFDGGVKLDHLYTNGVMFNITYIS
ncbi:MAG: porin family protein [Tatlockia sp.]